VDSKSTITALATPHGNSALAILRLSGNSAFTILKTCLNNPDVFEIQKHRSLSLYKFINKERLIDHISVIKYYSPRSYTGEDLIEIICHGGKIVVEQILETLIQEGAEYAKPGEFTKRAFLSGKMDLIRAEAIAQMVTSSSVVEFNSAVNNYFGGYKPLLSKWKTDVEKILSEIEAIIEFGAEHDINETEIKKQAKTNTESIIVQIEKELNMQSVLKNTKQGIMIAIVGTPNAGKSTLLNLILGYERSIVFHEEGTTRDAVSEWMRWQNLDVQFIDSAGIRANTRGVEELGVNRSWEFVDKCELIILVTAANEKTKNEEDEIINRRGPDKKIIGIVNKTDIYESKHKEEYFQKKGISYMCCSAIDKEYRQKVIDFVLGQLEKNRLNIEQTSIICTIRQEEVLKKARNLLQEMNEYLEKQEEIAAIKAKDVLCMFEQFAGKSSAEEILNNVFSRMCVGK
jgi:tRNA modification GTPase